MVIFEVIVVLHADFASSLQRLLGFAPKLVPRFLILESELTAVDGGNCASIVVRVCLDKRSRLIIHGTALHLEADK